MKRTWRFLKRHGQRLTVLAIIGVVFMLWTHLFTRVLGCRPRASWQLPVAVGGLAHLEAVADDGRVVIMVHAIDPIIDELHVWDTHAAARPLTLQYSSVSSSYRLTPNGRTLAYPVLREWYGVDFFDVVNGSKFATLDGSKRDYSPLALSADGQIFVYSVRNADKSISIQIWDVSEGTPVGRVGPVHPHNEVELAANGLTLSAYRPLANRIGVWNCRDGSVRAEFDCPTPMGDYRWLLLSADGGVLLSYDRRLETAPPGQPSPAVERIIRWDVTTGERREWQSPDYTFHIVGDRSHVRSMLLTRKTADGYFLENPLTGANRAIAPREQNEHADDRRPWGLCGPVDQEFWIDERQVPSTSGPESWLSGGVQGLFWPGGRHLRFTDAGTGNHLGTIRCERHIMSADCSKLATIHTDRTIAIWDLPLRRPVGLIVLLSFLHTALLVAACWYFARRRATEADAS